MQFSKLLAKRKSTLPVTINGQEEETIGDPNVRCKNIPLIKTKTKEEVHGLTSYVSKQL